MKNYLLPLIATLFLAGCSTTIPIPFSGDNVGSAGRLDIEFNFTPSLPVEPTPLHK